MPTVALDGRGAERGPEAIVAGARAAAADGIRLRVFGDPATLAAVEQIDGAELEPQHGGPLRLLVPSLYFWKSAKWLRGLELLNHDAPGFWERLGYSNTADPWKEERYAF